MGGNELSVCVRAGDINPFSNSSEKSGFKLVEGSSFPPSPTPSPLLLSSLSPEIQSILSNNDFNWLLCVASRFGFFCFLLFPFVLVYTQTLMKELKEHRNESVCS